jgi:hypothetical protein
MGLSTTLFKAADGEVVDADTLRKFLEISHKDTPIMLKIGDTLVAVREIRHVFGDPGTPVMKVLVPVDFVITSK